jgi:hypothetical protein
MFSYLKTVRILVLGSLHRYNCHLALGDQFNLQVPSLPRGWEVALKFPHLSCQSLSILLLEGLKTLS